MIVLLMREILKALTLSLPQGIIKPTIICGIILKIFQSIMISLLELLRKMFKR